MVKTSAPSDKNTPDFWLEVVHQFHPMYRIEQPTYILSPAQTRRYQLAYLKVPKYGHLLSQPDPRKRVCIVEKSFFEAHFDELYSLGLIDTASLEPRFRSLLPPSFQRRGSTWESIVSELGILIDKRDISARFAQLWSLYLKRNQIMLFVDYFDPYAGAAKSVEKNESSEVDRYIYSLWMHSFRYQGVRGTKERLIMDLSIRIDEILEGKNVGPSRPWYFDYLESLRNVRSKKTLIIRTVTDMTVEEINDYATDGAFTKKDFWQLFSVT